MSTILEALRKLQTDREQTVGPPRGELRTHLVEVRSSRRDASRAGWLASSRVLAFGGVAIGIVGLVVAGIGVWSGGAASFDPLDRAVQRDLPPRLAQSSVSGASGAPTASPPQSGLSQDSAGAQPEAQRLDAAPSFPPTRLDAFPSLTPAQLAAIRDAGMDPELRSLGQARAPVPALRPPPERPPLGESEAPAVPVERAPELNFRPPQAEPLATAYEPPLSGAPDSVDAPARSKPRPAGLLSSPRLTERGRQLARERERELAARRAGPSFPDLMVENVVWHPTASRRSATVLLDGDRVDDVREGDLVQGVMVERIELGSVVFRIGDDRREVNLGS